MATSNKTIVVSSCIFQAYMQVHMCSVVKWVFHTWLSSCTFAHGFWQSYSNVFWINQSWMEAFPGFSACCVMPVLIWHRIPTYKLWFAPCFVSPITCQQTKRTWPSLISEQHQFTSNSLALLGWLKSHKLLSRCIVSKWFYVSNQHPIPFPYHPEIYYSCGWRISMLHSLSRVGGGRGFFEILAVWLCGTVKGMAFRRFSLR